MTTPRAGRRVGRKLLISLGTTLALLALAELGLRTLAGEPPDSPLLEPHWTAEGVHWGPSVVHREDPLLIWRNRANLDTRYLGTSVRTNALGLRNGPVERHKPPGVYRILSLGESSTFGSKVEQNQTYSAVLERCLNERHPERRFEVLNAGVVGWTLAQSWAYLEHEGLDLEPDAILLYHGFNDFLLSTYMTVRTSAGSATLPDRHATDLEVLERPRGLAERLKSELVRRSELARWLLFARKRVRQEMAARRHIAARSEAPEPTDPGGIDTSGHGDVRVPEADRRELLERIRLLAEERSIELVVLIPAYRECTAHRQVLLDFAARTGAHLLDLEPAVAALGGERAELFWDPAHPKAPLHAEFARLICDYFDQVVLPESAGRTGLAGR